MQRIATLILSLAPVPAEERSAQNNFAVAKRLCDEAIEQKNRELLAA